MTKIFISLAILLAVANCSDAKVWQMCELARVLNIRYGFNRANLADWMCLVSKESAYNQQAVSGVNSNGSRDWGLWQINDKFWCGNGYRGGDCNMNCQQLLDDNLDDDVACVRKIFGRHGYNAWYGWINGCKNKPLPNVNACF